VITFAWCALLLPYVCSFLLQPAAALRRPRCPASRGVLVLLPHHITSYTQHAPHTNHAHHLHLQSSTPLGHTHPAYLACVCLPARRAPLTHRTHHTPLDKTPPTPRTLHTHHIHTTPHRIYSPHTITHTILTRAFSVSHYHTYVMCAMRLLYLGTSGYRPLTTHIERLTRKGSRMPASLDRRSGTCRWHACAHTTRLNI
jgi:hypothetical protein